MTDNVLLSPYLRHLPIRIGLLVHWLLWIPVTLGWGSALGAVEKTEPALPTSAQWLVGQAFQQQLQKPLEANWSGASLRRITQRIASNQRICIVLDRRIDPDQLVDFRASGNSLERSLEQLARQLNLGYCKIGPCIYLGPRSTTARLATVSEVKRQELSKAPDRLKQRLTASTGWQWKRLSTPNDLLQQQVRAAGLSLAPTDQLPHDLWTDQTLPPLDFSQRMSILLAGFNLTFTLNTTTGQLQLIRLPEKVSLTRHYSKRLSPANLAKVKTRFPSLVIKQTGDRLEVRGSQEEHELLARLLRGETIRRTVTKPSEKRFTLRVMQAPAAAIIDSVVQQQKYRIRLEPNVAERLKTLVNLDLTEATLDELLRKTLEPLGLTYQLENQQLTIREK